MTWITDSPTFANMRVTAVVLQAQKHVGSYAAEILADFCTSSESGPCHDCLNFEVYATEKYYATGKCFRAHPASSPRSFLVKNGYGAI